MGESHLRMSQVYKNLPVIHSEIIIHTKLGHPYLINGRTKEIEQSLNIDASLTNKEAEQAVI
ncbi:MAG: Zn-dependent metalloprotease [Saprospiraceae bacterium]|jgi:Zn-dependent metalloprotease